MNLSHLDNGPVKNLDWDDSYKIIVRCLILFLIQRLNEMSIETFSVE